MCAPGRASKRRSAALARSSPILALLLTREEIVRTSLTIVLAAFAVIHIGRARRAGACLHALHHTGRTG